METTLTLIGTAVAIIVSAISVFIAYKKNKPEIQSIEANTDKTRAEIMRIYGEELLSLKEQIKNERKESEQIINDLESKVSDLKDEQKKYKEFINLLLVGISKLIDQIIKSNSEPVWIPPKETPFDI